MGCGSSTAKAQVCECFESIELLRVILGGSGSGRKWNYCLADNWTRTRGPSAFP